MKFEWKKISIAKKTKVLYYYNYCFKINKEINNGNKMQFFFTLNFNKKNLNKKKKIIETWQFETKRVAKLNELRMLIMKRFSSAKKTKSKVIFFKKKKANLIPKKINKINK